MPPPQAALALEKLDVAQADLKAALALAPGPSLVRTINALREQARQMEVLLKGPSGRDADQQDAVGLVQEQQTLRLFLKVRHVGGAEARETGAVRGRGAWTCIVHDLKCMHAECMLRGLSVSAGAPP
jgi:hypothetical protein